jgi:hypothetical protein
MWEIPAGKVETYGPTRNLILSSSHAQDTATWCRAEVRSMLNATLSEMQFKLTHKYSHVWLLVQMDTSEYARQ